MGVEIVLLPQIGLVVFADEMIEQGDRDDQRHIAVAVCIDDLQHLLLLVCRQIIFEIAKCMQQDIAMFFGRGQNPQCLGQKKAISSIRLVEFRRQVGHEPAHSAIMFLAVSKKEHFMTGMKIDKCPPPGRHGDEIAEVPVNEDALDEVLSQPVIVEPTILLHRQEGEMAHEGSGEHADTGSMGHSILRVDLDPEKTAAR